MLRQGYGLTEAGPCITSLHHHDALWKKGSIGKPNFYVDYKIVNEQNEEVGVNKPGEFCIHGNIVTPGYGIIQLILIKRSGTDGCIRVISFVWMPMVLCTLLAGKISHIFQAE